MTEKLKKAAISIFVIAVLASGPALYLDGAYLWGALQSVLAMF